MFVLSANMYIYISFMLLMKQVLFSLGLDSAMCQVSGSTTDGLLAAYIHLYFKCDKGIATLLEFPPFNPFIEKTKHTFNTSFLCKIHLKQVKFDP